MMAACELDGASVGVDRPGGFAPRARAPGAIGGLFPRIVLAALVALLLSLAAQPATADPQGSRHVAVLGAREGVLDLVFGARLPALANVSYERIESLRIDTTLLKRFDTVLLLEACNVDPPLSALQLEAVVAWVRDGRKLLIADSDRCVPPPRYDWLPFPFRTDNPGARGDHSGRITILADGPLGSSDPAATDYVDTAALSRETDSGDANVMISRDPSWCATVVATNLNRRTGATVAYAYLGRGLVLYNGLDLDDLGRNRWYDKLFELQLHLAWDPATGAEIPGLPAAPACPAPVASLGDVLRGPMLPRLPPLPRVPPAVIYPAGLFALVLSRNSIVRLIVALINLLAVPFLAASQGLAQITYFLRDRIEGALAGLNYVSEQSRHRPASQWPGWWVIWPLVYFFWLLVVAGADLYVTTLRFELLVGAEGGELVLPIGLGSLLGVVWVALSAFFGFLLADLYDITPFDKPWFNLTERQRERLKGLVWAGLALAIAATTLLTAWGQMVIAFADRGLPVPEPLNSYLKITVMGVLGVLLVTASALAGYAVFTGIGSLWLLCQIVLQQATVLVRMPLRLPVVAAPKLARALVALVDLPARPMRRIWDWLSGFGWAQRLRLGKAVFIDLPPVEGDDEHAWWYLPAFRKESVLSLAGQVGSPTPSATQGTAERIGDGAEALSHIKHAPEVLDSSHSDPPED